ncbi:uncharacterized protein LOC116926039 [Daphnia magna]|uniref:uncharacterized protein LOC116926039 n=1 Tax=Daphnia magna TaxID=35525 RepID=UPI001E1BCC00|nr:uncharacterized protein LOC116926039 [Daphnia magna]
MTVAPESESGCDRSHLRGICSYPLRTVSNVPLSHTGRKPAFSERWITDGDDTNVEVPFDLTDYSKPENCDGTRFVMKTGFPLYHCDNIEKIASERDRHILGNNNRLTTKAKRSLSYPTKVQNFSTSFTDDMEIPRTDVTFTDLSQSTNQPSKKRSYEELDKLEELANMSLSGNSCPSIPGSKAKPAIPKEVLDEIIGFMIRFWDQAYKGYILTEQQVKESVSAKLMAVHTKAKKTKKRMPANDASASNDASATIATLAPLASTTSDV